jgi:hypothetical protein
MEQRKLVIPQLDKTDGTEERKEKKGKNRQKRKAETNNNGILTKIK